MAWLLAQKPWIVPIPGTTQMAHMLDNSGASEVSFTPSELSELNESVSAIEIQGRSAAGPDPGGDGRRGAAEELISYQAAVRYIGNEVLNYSPWRRAGVWTGASHRRAASSSSSETVSEQPAMSSEVT